MNNQNNSDKKYIFENGVMKKNPAYKANQPTTLLDSKKSLAIVSSTTDIQEASEIQKQATGKPMQLSTSTVASMEIMQDQDYLNQFQIKEQKLDGGDMLDGLSSIFSQYEVPIGLINKLLSLSEYHINFIIDDSGSMSSASDASIKQASIHLKNTRDPSGQRAASYNHLMTRWEEVEDRLHVMLDMLAYLPVNVTMMFLNRKDRIELKHAGKTPEVFAKEAHDIVSKLFNKMPTNGTPLWTKISESFNKASGNTMHYVFTDGAPSDASIDKLKKLIVNRKNPKNNPVTFISCTDDNAADWMKEVDEEALYTAEIDDFVSEQKEVYNKQGPALPFSKGFWLLCQLVGSINPYDLDGMDETDPFTKGTMNNLMGRQLTQEEYQYYFNSHPQGKHYAHLMKEFCRDDIMTHQIMGTISYDNEKKHQQKLAAAQPKKSFFNFWNKGANQPPQQVQVQQPQQQQQIEGQNDIIITPAPASAAKP